MEILKEKKMKKKPYSSEFEPKRFALSYNPPMIILEYMLKSKGKLYLRKMKLLKLQFDTSTEATLKYLKMRYCEVFETKKIKDSQMITLIEKLKDSMRKNMMMKKKGYDERINVGEKSNSNSNSMSTQEYTDTTAENIDTLANNMKNLQDINDRMEIVMPKMTKVQKVLKMPKNQIEQRIQAKEKINDAVIEKQSEVNDSDRTYTSDKLFEKMKQINPQGSDRVWIRDNKTNTESSKIGESTKVEINIPDDHDKDKLNEKKSSKAENSTNSANSALKVEFNKNSKNNFFEQKDLNLKINNAKNDFSVCKGSELKLNDVTVEKTAEEVQHVKPSNIGLIMKPTPEEKSYNNSKNLTDIKMELDESLGVLSNQFSDAFGDHEDKFDQYDKLDQNKSETLKKVSAPDPLSQVTAEDLKFVTKEKNSDELKMKPNINFSTKTSGSANVFMKSSNTPKQKYRFNDNENAWVMDDDNEIDLQKGEENEEQDDFDLDDDLYNEITDDMDNLDDEDFEINNKYYNKPPSDRYFDKKDNSTNKNNLKDLYKGKEKSSEKNESQNMDNESRYLGMKKTKEDLINDLADSLLRSSNTNMNTDRSDKDLFSDRAYDLSTKNYKENSKKDPSNYEENDYNYADNYGIVENITETEYDEPGESNGNNDISKDADDNVEVEDTYWKPQQPDGTDTAEIIPGFNNFIRHQEKNRQNEISWNDKEDQQDDNSDDVRNIDEGSNENSCHEAEDDQGKEHLEEDFEENIKESYSENNRDDPEYKLDMDQFEISESKEEGLERHSSVDKIYHSQINDHNQIKEEAEDNEDDNLEANNLSQEVKEDDLEEMPKKNNFITKNNEIEKSEEKDNELSVDNVNENGPQIINEDMGKTDSKKEKSADDHHTVDVEESLNVKDEFDDFDNFDEFDDFDYENLGIKDDSFSDDQDIENDSDLFEKVMTKVKDEEAEKSAKKLVRPQSGISKPPKYQPKTVNIEKPKEVENFKTSKYQMSDKVSEEINIDDLEFDESNENNGNDQFDDEFDEIEESNNDQDEKTRYIIV